MVNKSNVDAWIFQQATLLNQGRFEEIDINHIKSKIEGMSNSQKRSLVKLLEVLLMYLLTDS